MVADCSVLVVECEIDVISSRLLPYSGFYSAGSSMAPGLIEPVKTGKSSRNRLMGFSHSYRCWPTNVSLLRAASVPAVWIEIPADAKT